MVRNVADFFERSFPKFGSENGLVAIFRRSEEGPRTYCFLVGEESDVAALPEKLSRFFEIVAPGYGHKRYSSGLEDYCRENNLRLVMSVFHPSVDLRKGHEQYGTPFWVNES